MDKVAEEEVEVKYYISSRFGGQGEGQVSIEDQVLEGGG